MPEDSTELKLSTMRNSLVENEEYREDSYPYVFVKHYKAVLPIQQQESSESWSAILDNGREDTPTGRGSGHLGRYGGR